MSNKRKPPTFQQKKDEVNTKAIIWSGSIVGLLIIVVTIVIILSNT